MPNDQVIPIPLRVTYIKSLHLLSLNTDLEITKYLEIQNFFLAWILNI